MSGEGPSWRDRGTYPTREAAWTSPPTTRSLAAPTWCALPDGRALLAFVESEPGMGDRLRSLVFSAGAPGAEDAGTVPGAPSQVFEPVLAADDQGRPWLSWIELVEGRGTLQGSTWQAGSWSPPRTVRVTGQPVVAHHALHRSDGSLVVAWQEFVPADQPDRRGRYRLFASVVKDGQALDPVDASADHRLDDNAPVLAETGGGDLWLVFVRDQGGDREVMARTLDLSAGEAGPVCNLSNDAWSDDLHPCATAAGAGRLWVAFDSIQMQGRGASTAFQEDPPLRNRNRVRLLALEDGRVWAVSGTEAAAGMVPAEAPDSQAGGHPCLVQTGDGVLHLLQRAHWSGPRRTFDYPLLHQAVIGPGWRPASILGAPNGAATTAAAMARPGGVWLAWEALVGDGPYPEAEELRRFGEQDLCLTGRLAPGRLQVAWMPDQEEAAPPPELRGLPTVERPPRPQPLRDPTSDPITLGDRHHQVHQGDTTWTVYWGDLHRHSSVSPCTNGFEPGPEDRYWSARQVARDDFFALTDHTSAMTPEEWWHLSKRVDLHQAPDFVTLQGYEWNSSTEGHVNVILRERSDQILCNTHPRGGSLAALGRNLDGQQAITIPHTTASQAITVDWDSHDSSLLRVVEVYQAQRGSYEFGGCYLQARNAVRDGSFVQDGLAAGRTFGLIASTDHGNGAAYTAVLARELTREAIFEALQARRTYAATSKGLLLDFRVGDRLMGQRATATGDPLPIEVRVEGTAELAEVVVFRDGQVWQAQGRGGRNPEAEGVLTLELRLPPEAASLAGHDLRLSFPERGRFTAALRGRLKEHDPARPVSAWRAADRQEVVYRVGGEPTGALARRVRLHGSDRSPVLVRVDDGPARQTTLGDLRQGAWTWPDPARPFRLVPYGEQDAQVDPARGMGVSAWSGRFEDAGLAPGEHWYYVRVIQTDGEAAWSSPVFVRKP